MRAWDEERDFRELVARRPRDRRAARRGRARRRLRPRGHRPSRRHRLRAPRRARAQGGARACLTPPFTSAAARSASCTRSTTTACCSSRATASRRSTSSCRPRSPTRAACSPGSPAFWFARTQRPRARTTCSRCATDGRSTECRRLEMLPIECVVRGYLAGSGWKDYLATGAVCGHALPAGLRESEQLPEPIFTPATKAQTGPRREHRPRRGRRARRRGALRRGRADRRSSSTASSRSTRAARGIILADTKLEFGVDDDGPARARRRGVHARLVALLAGRRVRARRRAAVVRQAVRARLLRDARLGQDRTPGPSCPDDVVAGTRGRYVEAFERLTGIALRRVPRRPEVVLG